ncbi:MAG: polyhydroxyalkanoate depolymerase [Aquisalimonadaceae bacterium]
MLYQAYQAHADMMWLSRTFARTAAPVLEIARLWPLDMPGMHRLAAACELFGMAQLTHKRRPFGIETVRVGAEDVPVCEEVVHATPFGSLLHFRKETTDVQPRVLIIAPMSGHFATLLRDAVRTMLADHDVYITDWHNARDIPLEAGPFGLEEYAGYIMRFLGILGPGCHLLAICQPCVPALAAVSIMAEDNNAATPRSLVLMAGPIDCRINPSSVNKLAVSKPLDWFDSNLVTPVPMRYKGAARRVYPGFMQVSAFMQMNLDRHIDTLQSLYYQLVDGDTEQADVKRNFYEEFFAVCDMPAEFYLQTIRHVFQEFALARGRLTCYGRPVRPEAIGATALLTVEGERDDVCGLGQTYAAHTLCSSLTPDMRRHHLQLDVGHFGTFNGSHWKNAVYPVVRDMIHRHS